jgi:hypothetical protein
LDVLVHLVNGKSDCVERPGVIDEINLLRAVFHNVPRQSLSVKPLLWDFSFANEVDCKQLLANLHYGVSRHEKGRRCGCNGVLDNNLT